jgi:hypothetical protein
LVETLVVGPVIASEAKQSSLFFVALDCLVASLLAMTVKVSGGWYGGCAPRRAAVAARPHFA